MGSLSLPVHSYRLRSLPASPARLLNCYAEALPPDAKTPVLLTRAPGITEWTEVGDGPIYGMHYAHGFLYVVSGTNLYRVSENKVSVLLRCQFCHATKIVCRG